MVSCQSRSSYFRAHQDEETRQLCVSALYKINDKTAKNELLHIYQGEQPNSDLRPAIAEHLRQAIRDNKSLSRTDARAVLNVIGKP